MKFKQSSLKRFVYSFLLSILVQSSGTLVQSDRPAFCNFILVVNLKKTYPEAVAKKKKRKSADWFIKRSKKGKPGELEDLFQKRFLAKAQEVDASTKRTTCADYSLKNIDVAINELEEKITIALQLWDMSGLEVEKYWVILPYCATGTQGILVFMDMTDPTTLVYLNDWMDALNHAMNRDLIAEIPCILISTDHQSTKTHKISQDDINVFNESYAIQAHYSFNHGLETLTEHDLNTILQKLTKKILKKKKLIKL